MTTETAANPADTSVGQSQQQTDGASTEGNGAAPAATQPAATQPAAEGAKPAGESTETTAEVVYEFTAPEGIELDKASTDEFTAIAKELKLSKADAQRVVDLAVKRESERMDTHRKTVSDWADQVKADKELGGDKLDETMATAKKAIDLGPPELKELLNNSGIGNHPAVVKWAYTVGKALSEDRFVSGKPGDKPPTIASRLFPNMNP